MFAPPSDILRYAKVDLKSDQFCQEKYGNKFIKGPMICAYTEVSSEH